jgi:hypothetical protein
MQDGVPRIFLSYARADAEFALRLAKDLRYAGTRIWMDQLDIPAGVPWDDQIEIALGQCRAMLLVLSPASVVSPNVKDELADALSKGKVVVPVLLAPCDLPLRLRRLQYVDFSVDYARGLERLLLEPTISPARGPDSGAEDSVPLRPPPPIKVEKADVATVVPPKPWFKHALIVVGLAVLVLGARTVWLRMRQDVRPQDSTSTPRLILGPATLDFGRRPVTQFKASAKSRSKPRSASLEPTAKGPGVAVEYRIEGINAADFAVEGSSCGGKVAEELTVTEKCMFYLTFFPSGSGQRAATLKVLVQGTSEAHEVALSGTGTAPEPPTAAPQDTSTSAVSISSVICTSLGLGRFKVQMSGTVSGPVGATFSANSRNDPGSETGTVCDFWPDAPPRDDGYVLRVCRRGPTDPGATAWKSSMVLAEAAGRPVKFGVVDLTLTGKKGETQFLASEMVPLSCK